MYIIILFTFLFLFTISKIILRDKLTFYFLAIYLVWCFLLLLISIQNPYKLYSVSNFAYFLLILNIFFFSLGFLLCRLLNKIKHKQYKNNIESVLLTGYNNIQHSKYFLFPLILFSILILNYLIKYQKIILLDGVFESRTMRFYVGKVFTSQLEIYFYNYIVESFSLLVSSFLAFSFVWKKFNMTFLLGLIFAFLFSAFGSGRGYVIEIGFLIVFLSLVKNIIISLNTKNQIVLTPPKSRLKSKYIIIPTLVFFYLFSIYLSNVRNGLFEININNLLEGNSYFVDQIVIYCVGSFRALDYGISNLSGQFPIMLGRLSFGGIDEILSFLFKIIGLNYISGNSLYGELTSVNFSIGFDTEYNALFTSVFGQYLDFGVLGVILLSIFWGYIFCRLIISFINNSSLIKLMIISFLFVTSITSMLSWKLQSPSSCLYLFALIFIEYKTNIFRLLKKFNCK